MISQDDPIRHEILHAALQLYRKAGPADVTMDNVAKAAGRSRSSLYYYFKNRDEIFQAVLERIAKDVAAEIRQAVNAAAKLNEQLYAFCMAKMKTTGDWKRVFTAIDLITDTEEKSKQTKLMDALHKKLIHLEREILMDVLLAYKPQSGRKATNAELDMLAFIMYAGTRGIRREIYDYNDPHDAQATAAMLSAMAAEWLER